MLKACRMEGGGVCVEWKGAVCVFSIEFVYVSFWALSGCLFPVRSVCFFGQLYECDRMCVFGTFLVHYMSVFKCLVLFLCFGYIGMCVVAHSYLRNVLVRTVMCT